MTSVYWRRANHLTVASSYCSRLGEPAVPHSVRLATRLFAHVRRNSSKVDPAVKEPMWRTFVHILQFMNKRLVSTHFELAGKCDAVNFVVAYATTDCIKDAELASVCGKRRRTSGNIPQRNRVWLY